MHKPWNLLLVVLLLSLSGCGYNDLQTSDEQTKASWSEVLNQYQRRADLVPNLVNTVKGYAEHEKELFEEVARLRSQWAGARSVGEKVEAASQLEGRIGRLLLVAEQYPQLKASESFRDLQHELAGTENRIAVERQRYNEAIRAYNVAVRQFPGSLLAAFRGFAPSDAYFEAADAAQEVPAVDFRREEAP